MRVITVHRNPLDEIKVRHLEEVKPYKLCIVSFKLSMCFLLHDGVVGGLGVRESIRAHDGVTEIANFVRYKAFQH